MSTPSVMTTRLTLRPFTLADTLPLFEIQNDPEVMRYFPNPQPPSRDKIKDTIQEQLEHWGNHGYGGWVIESSISAEIMGWAGLQYLPETDESEIGYLLGKPFWGKGYATEAARAAIRFGFENTEQNSFIGIVHLDNIASRKVLLHIGMTLVDQTNYFCMDCFRYRIIRSDYSPSADLYNINYA